MKETLRDAIVTALSDALDDDSQIDTPTLDRMADAVLVLMQMEDDDA